MKMKRKALSPIHFGLIMLLCADCTGTKSDPTPLAQELQSVNEERANEERAALQKQIEQKKQELAKLGRPIVGCKSKPLQDWRKLCTDTGLTTCVNQKATDRNGNTVQLCIVKSEETMTNAECTPNPKVWSYDDPDGTPVSDLTVKQFCTKAGSSECKAPAILSLDQKSLIQLCDEDTETGSCDPNRDTDSPTEPGVTKKAVEDYCKKLLAAGDSVDDAKNKCELRTVVDHTGNLRDVQAAQGQPICLFKTVLAHNSQNCEPNPNAVDWCAGLDENTCGKTPLCAYNHAVLPQAKELMEKSKDAQKGGIE